MKLVRTLVCIFLLNGCVVVPINSSYKAANINLSKKTNLTVAVRPFVNNVQDESYSHSVACTFKTLIPGWVYCTRYYLDDAGRKDFNRFMETMRKALVRDLKANNIFSSVILDENKKADIYISATVNEYSLTKKSTNYGVSGFGYVMGFLGAPMGWAHNDASITYTVTDKNGKKILIKDYEGHANRIYGYYYPAIISLGASFKPINNNFLNDLVKAL